VVSARVRCFVPRLGLRLQVLGLLTCLWVPAGVAHAYEDQLTLGLGAGYAHTVSSSLPRHGLLLDLSGSVGLSSALALRGRLSYAVHPADRPLHAGLAGAELLYLIDVVEVVPYFGAGLDAVTRAHAGNTDFDAAGHLVAGLDYLITRGLALELDLRSHLLFTAWRRDPVYLAATLGAIWMLDR
jgi:hypothetical protein